ncbi:MAG TPA: 4'-phosphopantetheinyl transferase [Erwinia sp.]|uniref:4'-phosphopantetheinyl transferase family protein n=1 Tax=Erwinia citreus TaxID=558 RepID=UPI000E9144B9|nr:4'-phosphopantetheinyl transferase superfamily protein [Erwinia sp.]HBV40177.1 4'-phosphopantetheinyl transferase [Erwinia sp.]
MGADCNRSQPGEPDTAPATDLFFNTIRHSPLAGHPDVLLVQARYDADFYRDSLFADYRLPFPEHLNRAVTKRRAEYLVSRVCVRAALRQFGVADFLLVNDADRAPVWPEGIAGSLSHTRACITLLLTSTAAGKLPGVDCEEIMRPEAAEEMRDMIINEREYSLLQRSGVPFATSLTAAFSLKESLYKALFPFFRQFMHFNDAEIIDCRAGLTHVTLRLNRGLSCLPVGTLFTGCVVLDKEWLTSWVILPHPSSGTGVPLHQ